jgi:GH24 family phage-related lysozyme (muramidase)
MAQVQSSEGIPEVAPHTSVPDDYQRIQATPEEFGGLIARGEQQLGQGAQTAAKFYGEAVADNAANEFQERTTKLLYGDPQKMVQGPDGKPQPDTGFFGLKGRAALDARPKLDDSMNSLTQELREQLSSPEQQLQFDNFTRRYRSLTQSEVGRHADSQANTWYAEVNNTAAKQQLNLIAANADKPLVVAHATRDLIDARVKTAQLQGGGDQLVNAAVDQAKREAAVAQIDAVAGGGDWAKAQRMTENYRKILGTEYERVANAVRAHADQQIGNQGADRAIAKATDMGGAHPPQHDQPVAGVPVSYLSAIQHEEGFDPHPKWDVHQWTVGYGTKAAGPNERPSKQELDQRFDGEISKAAATVDRINPNLDPGTKAALTSLTFNTGDAWTRSNLGQAVASGDIATAQKLFLQYNHVGGLFSPQIANRRSTEAAWFGNPEPPPPSPLQYGNLKSTAYQVAMNDPELRDNPQAMAHALQRINQSYTAAQIAADTTEKQRQEANDQAAKGYVSRILKGDTNGIVDQIADDPNLNHQTQLALGRAATTDTELGVYAKNFWGAYKGVTAAADDPARINTAAELFARAGPDGDLSLAGAAKLNAIRETIRKNADDAAVHTAKAGLMTYAKSKLSFDQEMLFPGVKPLSDPQGVQVFNAQFIPKFEAAYDAWIKKGKDPWEFLTQENIDKMITGMRSPAEMAMDRIGAKGDAEGEKADQTMPAPLPGITPPVWESLMHVRPIMDDGQPVSPNNWKEALRRLRENPETAETFNKHFKQNDDFDAKAILQKLGPAAVTNVPPSPQEGAAGSGENAPAAPAVPAVPARSTLDMVRGAAGSVGHAVERFVGIGNQ